MKPGFLLVVHGLLCAAQTITPLSDRVDGLSSPALSPDGTMLAYGAVAPDSSIWIDVRPLSGGKAVHFAGWRDDGGPFSPRWSPDGKQIAFLRFYCENCNHKLFTKAFPNGPEKLLGEVCGGTPAWTPVIASPMPRLRSQGSLMRLPRSPGRVTGAPCCIRFIRPIRAGITRKR
jgi:hypothetical protein